MILDRRSASSGGEYALAWAACNFEYDSDAICKRRSPAFERVPDPETRDGHPETSYRAAKEDANRHSASNYYPRVRAQSKEVYSRPTVSYLSWTWAFKSIFFRIKAYREEQAAIKHKEKLAIQSSKNLEKENISQESQKDSTEMPQDSFFLTQNLDEEEPPVQEKEKSEPEPTYESELSKSTALAMREAELDLEQELTPAENILELTEDEKVEYSYNVEPLSQTAAYNQLRALLM